MPSLLLLLILSILLLARLHIVYGGRLVTVAGVCRRRLSSFVVIVCRLSWYVTLHVGPVGGFTRAGQAMMSCCLQSNYSSTTARRASRVTSR